MCWSSIAFLKSIAHVLIRHMIQARKSALSNFPCVEADNKTKHISNKVLTFTFYVCVEEEGNPFL